jgi:peptide deformylase
MHRLLLLLSCLTSAWTFSLYHSNSIVDARSSAAALTLPRAAARDPRMMGRSRAPKRFKAKTKDAAEESAPAVAVAEALHLHDAGEASGSGLPPPVEDEINPGAVNGTDLLILEYPHPLLRALNSEVVTFDDSLRKLTQEMFAIMYASRGVGLAAPQLGINKRLMVFNPDGKKEKWMSEVVLCNPRIVEWGIARETDEEGCLSFPGFTADVDRANWIQVEFQNGRGRAMRKKYTGWEARIFQHEYDHLDGVLYVDRLSEAERARIQPELDRLVAAHGPGGAL